MGPVLSADLYGHETKRLEECVEKSIDAPLAGIREQVIGSVSHLVREAYINGLRDGFAQGVAAEHRAKEDPAT